MTLSTLALACLAGFSERLARAFEGSVVCRRMIQTALLTAISVQEWRRLIPGLQIARQT
jgi:hypothetical protein